MTDYATMDQPNSIHNNEPPIYALVIDDMRERAILGKARYNVFLQAFNGRDALVDLYQELLDAVVYTRQLLQERDTPTSEIAQRQNDNQLLVALPVKCPACGSWLTKDVFNES